jgi:hypothetical protein
MQQLAGMGFNDEAANRRALELAGGNVNGAVPLLLARISGGDGSELVPAPESASGLMEEAPPSALKGEKLDISEVVGQQLVEAEISPGVEGLTLKGPPVQPIGKAKRVRTD